MRRLFCLALPCLFLCVTAESVDKERQNEVELSRDEKVLMPGVKAASAQGQGFCLGDWNGDGKKDLIVMDSAAHGEGGIQVYLGNGRSFGRPLEVVKRLPHGRC